MGPEGALIAVVDGFSAERDGICDRMRAEQVLEGIAGFQPQSDPEEVLDWVMEHMPSDDDCGCSGAAALVARVLPTGEAVCSWCGDVRAYVGDADGGLLPITAPHRRFGVIESFVGSDCAQVETESFVLSPDDTLLVVTDGVWEPLGSFGLAASMQGDPRSLAFRLIGNARACVGDDDCTAVTARFVASG